MQGKVYIPWYKAANNTFVAEEDMFDEVDGYCFVLTVYRSLNKKGELVEDIIRVKHLGKVNKELLIEYLSNQQLPIYHRERPVVKESVVRIIAGLSAFQNKA